jgi:hypothetical protein
MRLPPSFGGRSERSVVNIIFGVAVGLLVLCIAFGCLAADLEVAHGHHTSTIDPLRLSNKRLAYLSLCSLCIAVSYVMSWVLWVCVLCMPQVRFR